MVQEYVHQSLNQEITAVGGHYALVKEAQLPFRGQEVLYLIGHALFDTACCGVGGCAYALVPGFLVRWKGKRNKDGLAVSQVEPIRDGVIRGEIQRLIEQRETVHQVRFQ